MRKVQILGAFVAVLAFSALAVSSASATLWLSGGASLTKEVAASSHGEITLHHSGGLTGNYVVTCTGLFDGTVGPGALDLITKVLGLKGEENLITCEFLEGTTCGNLKELVLVHAIHLPWHTLLVLLEDGTTSDIFLSESGKEPGYEFICPKDFNLKGSCAGEDYAQFSSQGTNGAILEFPGIDESPCTDGGKGKVTGLGEMLGFNIS